MNVIRELARIFGCQTRRIRLIFERRKLARLESALGLLGWQQADYEGPAQDEVQRLNAYEREQARLTNESAQCTLEALKLEERRKFEGQFFAEAQATLLQRSGMPEPTEESLGELLEAKRKESREIEARLPVIAREEKEAEAQYRALVGTGEPLPEVRAQILRWQKLLMSLPRERTQWQEKSQEIKRDAEAIAELLGEVRESRKEFEKADQAILEEIAERQRSKRKVEKQIDALEKAKSNPYREIGRTLADHRIAPLNQPEALTHVLAQREEIAAIEAEITALRAGGGPQGTPGALPVWLIAGILSGAEMLALLAIAPF